MRPEPVDLDKQMQAIWEANSKAAQTRKRLDSAQLRHNVATRGIEKACEEYNLARAQMIIDTLVEAGMGICQSIYAGSIHIEPEEGMKGVIYSGTRTRGGEYYAHDEPYVDTRLCCKKCLKKITLRPGRVTLIELDVRAVWSKLVLDAAQLFNYESFELERWAKQHGIPARIKLDQNMYSARVYMLGDEKLELVR